MTATNRLALAAGLAGLAFALSACPDPSENNGGKNDAGQQACTDPSSGDCTCVVDEDCVDPNLFFCNQTTSTCQPACRTKEDCSAAKRGDYALSYCEGNLGCQCDEGTCIAALCSTDSDCGSGNACRNGTCVPAPAAAAAAKCQITPDFAVVKSGEPVQFWVSFQDASNNPVVLTNPADVSWALVGSRLSDPQGSGATATFTGGVAGTAEEAVKVTAGGATCTAKVATLDALVPPGKVRVTTINELTGRPVSGGLIQVTLAADGTELGSAPMDASGTTLVSLPKGVGNITVSAFHSDYGYMTVANYDVNGSRDLLLALRRNQTDKYGGVKGTLTDPPQTPNVHAGIMGMSIPGAVTDLSLTQLLGTTVPTNVKIGTAIDQKDVPLPAGAFIGFSQEPLIKKDVSAQGLAGVCTSDLSGVTDVEAAIENGECGTRTAWVLAGDVPLGDLPIDAFAGGVDNIDFGKVLSRILPIFKHFTSSVVRDVQFDLHTTPVENGDYNFSDTTFFTEQNAPFNGVPLGFSFAAQVPDLPKFHGKYADGVIILGGADVKGRGVVPLGLGAGVNTGTVDAKVDTQAELPSPGLVLVRMAPTHSGIEGSQYALVAVAASMQSLNDASAGLALSAVVHRFAQNKLVFDPKGETPVAITEAYLNFPESAKYNFTSAAQPGLAARTFKFVNGQDLSAASVIRIQFTDYSEHRWQVVTDPATAASGFVLPAPPSPYADRTFAQGNTGGERSTLLVQAIQLQNGSKALSFKDFVQLNGTNMDRLGDLMTAFSAIDYGRPSISWTTPGSPGTTIPVGSTVKLAVKNFKVGTAAEDDGVVKITFAGGNASCTDVTIDQDTSMGKGELSAALPAGCSGTNVQLTATLFNKQNQPIAPPVASSTTATIQ